ncbi:hypothetical protein C8R44DRAFT_851490 [Mycena epipterygia]|nr:hypothetical protein C8R44DRAFT_851490 [Mycena epipterygia]
MARIPNEPLSTPFFSQSATIMTASASSASVTLIVNEIRSLLGTGPERVFTKHMEWPTFVSVRKSLDSVRESSDTFPHLQHGGVASAVHETAHREMGFLIKHALKLNNPLNLGPMASHRAYMSDATQVSLEGDSVLAVTTTPDDPTFFIECGYTQTRSALMRKTDAWLYTNCLQSVLAIMVIDIHRDLAKTVDMQIWQRNINVPAGRSIYWQVSVTQQSFLGLGALSIPYSLIFPAGSPPWAAGDLTFTIPAADIVAFHKDLLPES